RVPATQRFSHEEELGAVRKLCAKPKVSALKVTIMIEPKHGHLTPRTTVPHPARALRIARSTAHGDPAPPLQRREVVGDSQTRFAGDVEHSLGERSRRKAGAVSDELEHDRVA